MHNLQWRILIILVVLAICAWQLVSNGIRWGRDLAGGLSVIYQVKLEDTDDPEQVMPQVVDVLKNRLNPTGAIDLSVTRQGTDRIEISIPLPDERVKAAQQAYRDAIDSVLRSARIDPNELESRLQAGEAVKVFGGPEGTTHWARMDSLQKAYDRQRAARAAYEAARGADPRDEAALARAEAELAEAEVVYDALLTEALRYSLREPDLLRLVQLSNEPRDRKDPETGRVLLDENKQRIKDKSLRQLELESLQERFPHLKNELAAVVEKYDTYAGLRRGFDDIEDLKRMVRGAGVLEFRIAATAGQNEGFNVDQMREALAEHGPTFRASDIVRWMAINDVKQWYKTDEQLAALTRDPVGYFAGRGLIAAEYRGRIYLLIYDAPGKKLVHDQAGAPWSLQAAFPTQDSLGRPAVGFRLDSAGGIQMGQLTGSNVNRPMAIVLDDEVFSAPNINSRIGGNGIIEGNFSAAEINYLIRVLASGSLQARLLPDPVAQNVLGPSIGRDNLERGLWACLWSILATCAFMMVYYFFAGAIANFALLCNALIIFGVMAMQQASFTLPGIAGVVLTIGMAVDANVLIYERMREEIFAGEKDLRSIVKIGYSKALSTIIDGNLTNLIVAFALYQTASTEIKGFALTLGIGIASTLFTALFVTRTIYIIYADKLRINKLEMLPTAVPAIHRALEPNINWVGLRRIFIPMSFVLVVASVVVVGYRGQEIYDTEFRGGISATMQTRPSDPGDPQSPRILLDRREVQERVQAIADGPRAQEEPILQAFRRAVVLTAGAGQQGARSDSFQIKIAVDAENVTDTQKIVDAIVSAFAAELGQTSSHDFRGAAEPTPPVGATYPISGARYLSQVIERPGFDRSVAAYDGGVAIVIDEINPPATLSDVRDRIARMRQQRDFSDTVGRDFDVIGLTPAPSGDGYTSLCVLVADPALRFADSAERWESFLATREWQLVGAALARPASLEQVSSFSGSVADTLFANAVTAVALSLMGILVYIWIRFGSLRYSVAAVVALVHDAAIALGALALTHYISGSSIANLLLIEDFHINLGVVAGLLTIIGYSLNDTIVILDRIRENRGKRPLASAEVVNASINQTISRTVLTGGTTLIAAMILFAEGGTGIRDFTFVLIVGLIVGTYSSVAIAAPIVYKASNGGQGEPQEEPTTTGAGALARTT